MALINLSRRPPEPLPEGAYDVRGWEVRTGLDDEKVGRVEDMLLDEHDRPRYLDVDLGTFRGHLLVPLAEAHADASEQVVWLDRMDRGRLRDLPEYDHDLEALSPAYERRMQDEWDRIARGEAQEAAAEPTGRSTLARLGDLGDLRVAKGVTDPRGWKLLSGDGHPVGEVRELIVDTAAMTTRYLDVDVDEKKLDLEPLDRHVLIPAERVRLDRTRKHVVVDGIFARDVQAYPLYRGLPLETRQREAIDEAFRRTAEAPESGGGEAAARRFFGVRRRPVEGAPPVRPRGRPDPLHEGEPHEPWRPEPESSRGAESETTVRQGDDEVRIRIKGEQIIIERKPTGSRDDG